MPETLKKLTDMIALLPGIGEKTAAKLAFFLLKSNPNYLESFQSALGNIQRNITHCETCGCLMDKEGGECQFCSDAKRETDVICVVEDYLDLVAIENTGVYRGLYHVLGGAISPVNGITAGDLSFNKLFSRLDGTIKELVIATNPNFEGEATALYIKEHIEGKNVEVSRLSRGLPNSGFIEYADDMTLINAFKGRQDF